MTAPDDSPLGLLERALHRQRRGASVAHPGRILSPLEAFRRERIHDTIVFFGSARITPDGALGRYYEEARELARLITEWSKRLAVAGLGVLARM